MVGLQFLRQQQPISAKVDSNGRLLDCNNNVIGRTAHNGEVQDRSNHTIGHANSVPRCHAAVFFFFDFKKVRNMKRYLYVLLMLLCISSAINAQTIRNTNNSIVAIIDTDGTVRNGNNSVIARISSNGDIRDNNNHLLGKIESDGSVKDRNNSYMGKVESNGTVRNRNNSILGKVESDGKVRDCNNHILGYSQGIPQKYAAVYFFFSFF